MSSAFDPYGHLSEEQSYWEGFKLHMWLAFREFDANFYETYVFTIVVGFTLLWAFSSVIQYIIHCGNPKAKAENRALVLLKDDLHKSGPYKRDRAGMPEANSVIKLHAVIFKHAQKKIIDVELGYQKRRIQHI